jgi:putative FmdB family regulatory protein
MPLYDFHCDACDKTFELLLKMTAPTPTCPQCGGVMEKLLSKPADPSKSKEIIASARARAKKEGHFSNYSKAEKKRL